MGITIETLTDHPDIAPVVARWCYREWGYLDPNASPQAWTKSLREDIHEDRMPAVFVALAESAPVGCVALVERDPATSMDLGPWLAALYVAPAHRGRGIGVWLAHYAIERARDFGIRELHACVTDRRLGDLCRRRGWRDIGQEFYKGRSVTVISRRLRT